jgi:hypothetical protein
LNDAKTIVGTGLCFAHGRPAGRAELLQVDLPKFGMD